MTEEYRQSRKRIIADRLRVLAGMANEVQAQARHILEEITQIEMELEHLGEAQA